MKLKKIMLLAILVAIILTSIIIGIHASKKAKTNNTDKIKVTVSNFASYDFLRAIIGNNDNVELTFLLGPGKDSHSYEPTAQDLITIQNSDLFVYVGGEMEKWADRVLDTLETGKTEIICIADIADKMEEKEIDGADENEHEHEHEEGAFDEHVWTSPQNAIKMINALENEMEKIDNKNSNTYKENSNKYIEKIKNVDSKIQNVVNNKVRDRLVFADKMPMQYFIDYYKLQVTAAFDGCSTETEPSAKTIAYIENKVKEEKIPVILYIELNNGAVAQTIANETGAKAIQIQTLHNVSKKDFDNGETWVSLMERNIDVLREALQ